MAITLKNFEERFAKTQTERIYVLESQELGNDEFRFRVMGSTAKVYQVEILQDRVIRCSCPDCMRAGRFCKHILLLLSRVLKVQTSSIREFLNFATDECIDACRKHFKTEEVATFGKPIDDEPQCPICYEDFLPVDPISACPQCRKNVHSECFQKWGKPICVYCRSAMSVVEMPAIKKLKVK